MFEYPIPIDVIYVFREAVDPEALKQSLRETLRHYPAFTGRLHTEGRGRLFVTCDDRGALFGTANSEVSVARLDEAGLAELSMDGCLLPNKWLRARGRDVPLFAVQHTRTACGGMILGVQAAHALIDGEGLIAFMRNWARVHRGEAVEHSPMTRHQYDELFGVREPRDDDPERVVGFKRMSRLMLLWKVLKLSWDSRSTVSLVLPFSGDEVARLGQNVRSPKARPGTALLAHVWQVFSRLRPNTDEDATGLFCVVGTRHLRDKRVEYDYFGNAVWHVRAESSYGHVRSAAIGELTELVQQAQSSLSYDEVCRGMQWLENQRQAGNLELGVVPDYELMRRDFFATNMWRLPMYEPDFGSGKAMWVTTQRPPVRWMIRLFPRPNGEGINVHCTVPRRWRTLLASDEVRAQLHRFAEEAP